MAITRSNRSWFARKGSSEPTLQYIVLLIGVCVETKCIMYLVWSRESGATCIRRGLFEYDIGISSTRNSDDSPNGLLGYSISIKCSHNCKACESVVFGRKTVILPLKTALLWKSEFRSKIREMEVK